MKAIILYCTQRIFLPIALLGMLCCCGPFIPDAVKVTTNTDLPYLGSNMGMVSAFGEWGNNNTIYSTRGYVVYDSLIPRFRTIKSEVIPFGSCLRMNKQRTKMLYSEPPTDNREFYKWGLSEYNVQTQTKEKIIENEYISAAMYNPANEDEIIFHTYGVCTEPHSCTYESKFYSYNRKTRTRTLLLDIWSFEEVKGQIIDVQFSNDIQGNFPKGFDIDPTGTTILIPVTKYQQPSIIARYMLTTKKLDTLRTFNVPRFNHRRRLWLRYSSDGKKILYNDFPTIGDIYDEPSEIGIFTISTSQKLVLNTRTLQDIKTIDMFPAWSADEKYILYASAPPGDPRLGTVGIPYLHVLKLQP